MSDEEPCSVHEEEPCSVHEEDEPTWSENEDAHAPDSIEKLPEYEREVCRRALDRLSGYKLKELIGVGVNGLVLSVAPYFYEASEDEYLAIKIPRSRPWLDTASYEATLEDSRGLEWGVRHDILGYEALSQRLQSAKFAPAFQERLESIFVQYHLDKCCANTTHPFVVMDFVVHARKIRGGVLYKPCRAAPDEMVPDEMDTATRTRLGRQALVAIVGLARLDLQHGDLDTYGNILMQEQEGEDFTLKILDYGAWACLIENPKRNRLLDLFHFQLQYPALLQAAVGTDVAAEVEALRPAGFGPETRDDDDLDEGTQARRASLWAILESSTDVWCESKFSSKEHADS